MGRNKGIRGKKRGRDRLQLMPDSIKPFDKEWRALAETIRTVQKELGGYGALNKLYEKLGRAATVSKYFTGRRPRTPSERKYGVWIAQIGRHFHDQDPKRTPEQWIKYLITSASGVPGQLPPLGLD